MGHQTLALKKPLAWQLKEVANTFTY